MPEAVETGCSSWLRTAPRSCLARDVCWWGFGWRHTYPVTGRGRTRRGARLAATPRPFDIVDIRAFTCRFTVKLTAPGADGFTFTVQAEGPHALGAGRSTTSRTNLPSSSRRSSIVSRSSSLCATRPGAPRAPSGCCSTARNCRAWSTSTRCSRARSTSAPGTCSVCYDGNILATQLTDDMTGVSSQDFQLIAGNIARQINSVSGRGFIGFTGGTGASLPSRKSSTGSSIPPRPLKSKTTAMIGG